MIDKAGMDGSPRTYHQSTVPIDTIICSANVKIRKVLYLPFGDNRGNCRSLIVDIDEISVFGMTNVPSAPVAKLQARHLKLNDPCIIAKYKNLLHKCCIKHKLYKKVLYLNSIPM